MDLKGKKVAVQQGAGMVVTKGSDEEIEASVEVLKYLTEPENNTSFSIGSGYLPVNKKANDMVEIRKGGTDLPKSMDKVLTKAVETVTMNYIQHRHLKAGRMPVQYWNIR